MWGRESWLAFLEKRFYRNPASDWLIAIGIALGVFILLLLCRRFFAKRPYFFSFGLTRNLDEMIQQIFMRIKPLVLLVISLYLGSQALYLQKVPSRVAHGALVLAIIFQLIVWGNYLIDLWVGGYAERHMVTDADKATTIRAAGGIGKLILWLALLLLTMDALGVNVTTVMAGLGIGGVAVALAAQKILGDLFASLSIVLDKPFVLGDFIVVGEDMGTIEKIGMKTTRIRSLSGEQLIFPNSDILQSRIRNYKRMTERRVSFNFGVIYQTTYEQLQEIPKLIKEIIGSVPETRIDRVNFKAYAPSSLDFETVYYVLSSDYNAYMNIQEKINLEIFKRFHDRGIHFAYPTQTVHMAQPSPTR